MNQNHEEKVNPEQKEEEVESVHQGLEDARGRRIIPWAWVPSAYFAEGVPYVLTLIISVVMFKKMGISNKDIAYYTSLLYLPWVIKPLWSPIVEIFKTKRWWVLIMQFLMSFFMLALAFVIPMPNFFKISVVFLWIIAFSSATHDIACDGFYMLGLTKHQQAWFVGYRATFYRLAMITGQGLLVVFAGWIESSTGLQRVDVNVSAVVQSDAPQEYLKYMEPPKQELDALKDKPGMDQLSFYLEKSKAVETLDESATLTYIADGVFASMKKENPEDPKLKDAEQILKSINESLNQFLMKEISPLNAGVKPLEGDLRLIVSSEDLSIPLIQRIPKNDANVTLFAVKKWNILQGQPEEKGKEKALKKPGPVKKIWTKVVVNPLGKFLKKYFSEELKAPPAVVGNIGYQYIHLSKAPPPGKKIIVAFGMKRGDKSIALKEGMRFEFTDQNWNKPVKAAIQLEHTLNDPAKALFWTTAGNIPLSWSLVFGLTAAIFLMFFAYHFFVLPFPVSDASRYLQAKDAGKALGFYDFIKEFVTTFISFFRKKGIVRMLLFLCLYRLGEAQLVKLSAPFLLDPKEKGGVGLTTAQYGIAYGTIGVICLILGGLLGGFIASRDGLKKWLLPMCLAINVPDSVYVYMSYYQPDSFYVVCSCVGFECFGYGFGFVAYMLYMIVIAEGKHKTAHYALATGFMALGMMIPGMFSGWIQSIIGYKHFFLWVLIATLPGFLLIYMIPLDPEFGKKKEIKEGAA